ncbi:MAG: hypothetical protein JO147_13565 [Actinobacteria bacterium]|nr:hypothetical protein [Actinomycetota bacterium]
MSGHAGLRYAFARVHHGETEMVSHLEHLAAKHRADHEIYFVALDMAEWSRTNLRQSAQVAADHDIGLSQRSPGPGPLDRLQEGMSTLLGRRPEPGLLLLEDLRDAYLRASQTSLAWEMLAQHAQAAHDTDILELAGRCHPQNLRQIRWCNTMLKTLAPQTLTSL